MSGDKIFRRQAANGATDEKEETIIQEVIVIEEAIVKG
jgi:hypothetical protein